MIITNVTTLPKKPTRYCVSIDNGLVYEVQDEVVVHFHLKKNQAITDEQLNQILAEDEFVRARQATAYYLQFRPRSVYEIKMYLRKKQYSSRTAGRIIDYFLEKGALDDKAFAEKYIRSQRRFKPVGPLKLKLELMQKGINRDIIHEKLSQMISADEEYQTACALFEKKLKHLHDKPYQKKVQSLYGYLTYHGISPRVARQVVDEKLQQHPE